MVLWYVECNVVRAVDIYLKKNKTNNQGFCLHLQISCVLFLYLFYVLFLRIFAINKQKKGTNHKSQTQKQSTN